MSDKLIPFGYQSLLSAVNKSSQSDDSAITTLTGLPVGDIGEGFRGHVYDHAGMDAPTLFVVVDYLIQKLDGLSLEEIKTKIDNIDAPTQFEFAALSQYVDNLEKRIEYLASQIS